MLPITPIQVPLILIPLVLTAAGNIVNLNQNDSPIEVKHELTFLSYKSQNKFDLREFQLLGEIEEMVIQHARISNDMAR